MFRVLPLYRGTPDLPVIEVHKVVRECGKGTADCSQPELLTMSTIYSALLVLASLLAMAAMGLLILVVITHIVQLAAPTNSYYGMNP